ncbi:MAG: helix-turn-helix domain-containing protein [Candidatus Pacebacteria bacterium]|nr:helix-turn-helix domain-containing protein [Candidatus Paceibacterota bacterium]
MLTQFKTKKVNITATAGELLKRKREKKGISIKEVSEKLKIKTSYLEDIEENNYNKLPPDVYVKGFIKSYSRLIGSNAQKMVDLYSKEKAIDVKMKNKNKEKSTKEKKLLISNYIIITPKILTVFFSLFILFIIGYYLWHQISSFNSTPYLFISNPIVDQISDKSEIEIAGQTEVQSVLKINGEDVFVDYDGYFNEIILLKPGNNVLNIEATNRFNRTSRQIRNIIYEKKLEPVPVDFLENNIFEENNKENIYLNEKIEFIGP